MDEEWRFGHRQSFNMAVFMAVLLLFLQNLSLCSSLNSEGLALLRFRERVVRDPFGALSKWDDSGTDIDPCSWFGVECSNGKVVFLNLRDLCLGGTLAPELGKLPKLKSIILRNNSFFGTIPKEIGELKELEVLDLGYNNFSGTFPSDFGNKLSLTTLLLDNNQYLGGISPELYELKTISEFQVEEKQITNAALRASYGRKLLFSWKSIRSGDIAYRRLLQRLASLDHSTAPTPSQPPSLSPSPPPADPTFSSPSPSPAPMVAPPPVYPPNVVAKPPQWPASPTPSPALTPSLAGTDSKSKHHIVLILAGIVGGSFLTLFLAIGIIFSRTSKVVTVKPWVTGLSGQLQKAFVTGVPKLKRAELEAACEDFSNIIGSYSDGTVYKGTLSSGVEIAVTSTSVKSRADWSKSLESQFRKKIDTLSKVNHKNFVNLIGFCVEDKPFTRMMVFEYAPNGTLFEHLHIQEAEHLDWGMRLRIAMGMAYCLEHMHQLTPPIAHRKLQSSSIYLTEDYAAKVSDFSCWNNTTAAKNGSASMEPLETSENDLESNVYNFGVILFEMITGRIPYVVDNSPLEDWASAYLRMEQPLKEMVDPTLKSFQESKLEKLLGVIKDCVHPDPKQRPPMRIIAAKLKEITAVGPDGAIPKLSPLWWAELEIMSTEASS
ncbi:probable inactive receptor-like protein kinase At3g56050 [Pistacia vera]|uniref:probable inactive receptor-like protein kinase At3g56050 n=1 Tax=Pistacia vera TaxID=55513 RepID=UPI0012632840|nr:probable inactive receptor-like protein kinase At3g56050 [Pistacia vera]